MSALSRHRPSGDGLDVIKTERAVFYGVPIFGAMTEDGRKWVEADPIFLACPDVGAARGTVSRFAKVLWITDDKGATRALKFLSHEDFLGIAIQSDRFQEFRDQVVRMLIQFDERGSFVPADVAGDETMKMLQALVRTRTDVIRAARLAEEVSSRQDALEADHARTRQIAAAALEAVNHGGGFFYAIPYLQDRGVHFPSLPANLKSTVGGECMAIALELGDNPRSRPKTALGGLLCHKYTKETLDEWYDRKRRRLDRRDWFSR